MAAQHVVEMARIDHALCDDGIRELRQISILEQIDDRVAIARSDVLPIDSSSQVRYWGQDVERLAIRWRERWIGECGHMQVERKVFRQHLSIEDVSQQFFVAGPED